MQITYGLGLSMIPRYLIELKRSKSTFRVNTSTKETVSTSTLSIVMRFLDSVALSLQLRYDSLPQYWISVYRLNAALWQEIILKRKYSPVQTRLLGISSSKIVVLDIQTKVLIATPVTTKCSCL